MGSPAAAPSIAFRVAWRMLIVSISPTSITCLRHAQHAQQGRLRAGQQIEREGAADEAWEEEQGRRKPGQAGTGMCRGTRRPRAWHSRAGPPQRHWHATHMLLQQPQMSPSARQRRRGTGTHAAHRISGCVVSWSYSASRCWALSFLLSSMPLMVTCSGTMQAAATTGPARRK